jgi:putative aminopeptidase FrvX
MNLELLKTLCSLRAPSGNETAMTEFLLDYIASHKADWKVQPQVLHGDFQDAIVLVFGTPRTAIYAHIDNIGFTVRYNGGLVKIGGPRIESGFRLVGRDSQGEVECTLLVEEDNSLHYAAAREIERGTELSFRPDFREDHEFVQSCYLDNRLGVYSALKVCETLEHGAVAFTCWEEHGKGSVSVVNKYLFEQHHIRQTLISDISWITEGVLHGQGPVISIRDSGIPRRSYVNRIIDIARKSGLPYQIEVEGAGGSDGIEIQHSPYPVDWCFVGAAEDFVHTPDEKVHKKDIQAMIDLYRVLMAEL